MSKIPYDFDPIPQYFRKNGWLKPKKDGSHFKKAFFLQWVFSKCSSEAHTVIHDNREILLEPFEFIFGRSECAKQTNLTDKEIRVYLGQLFTYSKGVFLKKTANSRANRYTCYKWMWSNIMENEGQLKGEQRANSGPTHGHNQDLRSKEDPDLIDLTKSHEKILNIDSVHLSYRMSKHPGVGRIEIDNLKKSLAIDLFRADEVDSAIQKFREQDPVVGSGSIVNYIKSIIVNQRKEYAKSKSTSNRKSASQGKISGITVPFNNIPDQYR